MEVSDRMIAVVGSRDWPDPVLVREFIANLIGDITIISGGARGVDTWAVDEAKVRGRYTTVFPAEWGKYGKGAGFMRNEKIVDAANELVAFWCNGSEGTRHSIMLARKKGIPISVCKLVPAWEFENFEKEKKID